MSFIKQLFGERRRERERALCRHLTFLYSLTIGALKAFHLWRSCGKIRELGLISLPVQYIYISAPIKASQYAITMYFPSEPCLPTIISTDILCANAVIDTFIISKEIQFSFQSSTGMNSATSSVANNEGPLLWAKGWLRLLYAFKGKSVSNCFPTPTFVLGKWRQLSDRLVSNFIVRQMSFLFGAMVITGLRHRCSSAVKPAVSPFNTLTLMSVADCQVQTWHPLSLHYVKRVTCRIHGLVLGGGGWGGGDGLIAWDIVDFATAINCSLADKS